MIKLFREIRYNLMETGKTTRYFKYAIGEIILVVIGILIALQINNWNISRVNSTKETEYLLGLKQDLQKEISALKSAIEFSNGIIDLAESILADYNSKNALNEVDNLNTKLSKLMFSSNLREIRTTFNELNSTGQLNLIQNKKLRSEIITYYQNSIAHHNTINGNRTNVFYPYVFPILRSSMIIQVKNFSYQPTTYDEETFQQKMQNQLVKDNFIQPSTFEIINAVSTRIISENSSLQTLLYNLETANILLLNIKTELESKDD